MIWRWWNLHFYLHQSLHQDWILGWVSRRQGCQVLMPFSLQDISYHQLLLCHLNMEWFRQCLVGQQFLHPHPNWSWQIIDLRHWEWYLVTVLTLTSEGIWWTHPHLLVTIHHLTVDILHPWVQTEVYALIDLIVTMITTGNISIMVIIWYRW